MYPNLNAEMARRSLTVKNLADKVGLTYQQLYPRLSISGHKRKQGFTDMPLSWAVRIRDALGVNMTIDELFEREK